MLEAQQEDQTQSTKKCKTDSAERKRLKEAESTVQKRLAHAADQIEQSKEEGLFTNIVVNDLYDETDVDAFLIGGAQKAGELDAKRAIDQGYRLAGAIETAEPGAVLEMPVGWQASALKMLRDAMGRNSA